MSSPTSVAARYKSVQVQTCSPGQLVVMLFDGAMRFTREAEAAMKAKDRGRAGERISKAHAVLEELVSTLDIDAAPELAENLGGLYLYAMGRLVQANIAQDPQILADVVEILRPLREGFAEAVAQNTAKSAAVAR
jgi:flagellar secretion chaperone FliS